MKKLNVILLAAIFISSLAMQSCKKDNSEDDQSNSSIIPTSFKVDIPTSLSNDFSSSKKGTKGDELNGNEVYEHLNTFIYIGESAAEVVQSIIMGITKHEINKEMSLSFEGDDDGRTKHLDVYEGATFEGQSYEFKLNITDEASVSEADGGMALQVFWSRNPVKGVAILKPYNLDRTNMLVANKDIMYRVDYSEAGTSAYEKEMIVYISDLPLADSAVDPYSMRGLKMFVGKKGTQIDVYGNSEHPNARLLSSNTGFDWAFVASGDEISDIGVAEVGLPSNSLDATSRAVLLSDNSIKNVYTAAIKTAYPTATDSLISSLLINAEAPGYFNKNGFIQGGTAPSSNYDGLVTRIGSLTPYNPKDISALSVKFD